MSSLLKLVLNKFIQRGSLTVTSADGSRFTCGDGSGPPAAIRFLTAEAERRLILDPELAFGEIYMDGTLVVDHGSIADVLAIALDQPDMVPRWAKLQWLLRYLLRHLQQFNPRGRSKRNIAHHYGGEDVNSRKEDQDAAAEALAAAGEFFDPEAQHDDEPAAETEK